jgi:3-methyladenine DNA glycosylase AlkD
MTKVLDEILIKLRKHGSKEKARVLQRFFKTGPVEYGEGDIFLGVKVPEIRKIAKEYHSIDLKYVKHLLRSTIHEERLLALLILVLKYSEGDDNEKDEIYQLYLKSTKYINNWDLVDLSAEKIIGPHLANRNRKPLQILARSDDLWERRIAILSTFHYIKLNDFKETLKVSKILLYDSEDLIHKAAGWMLRETGKRNIQTEKEFLNKYYRKMPRTMLRYAIERFPEAERQRYLKGSI